MNTATALQPINKITLAQWAASQFAQVPHANTLRKWAREGLIQPAPEFIGREYFVAPTARYVGRQK